MVESTYKLVIGPGKITEKNANFDHSVSLTRKIYLKLHVARNILVSRLLVACLKPLHSYVESEGLLPVHSYPSLDPNSAPIKFSPSIAVYALWPVLILSSYLHSILTTSVFLQVLCIQFFLFISCLSHACARDIRLLIQTSRYVEDTFCIYLLTTSCLLCPNYLVSTRGRCPSLGKEKVKFHDRDQRI